MDAERLRRVQDIFHEALERPPAGRRAYLDAACEGDDELRSAVEGYLAADADDFSLLDHHLVTNDESTVTDRSDPRIGQRVGSYRIERLLGRGGMGAVYLAHDDTLERPVALKFLAPLFDLDAEARDSFLTEARAAAAIDHANIATVHEIGETAEHELFIAMAYYEGETLKERLARGPLPETAT
jgi:serine/threonine-protein kinase